MTIVDNPKSLYPYHNLKHLQHTLYIHVQMYHNYLKIRNMKESRW